MQKHIEIENTGFRAPAGHPLGSEHRTAVFAEFVTGVALALSTMVLATVLSVGVARANVVDGVVGNEGSLFAIALLLGILFIGLGSISVFARDEHDKR